MKHFQDFFSSRLFGIIKITVAVIAAVNLIIMLTPGLGNLFMPIPDDPEAESEHLSEDSAAPEEELPQFEFYPEELTYDGIGPLDLLEGVQLRGVSITDLKKIVFTRITAGDDPDLKKIEYTADIDKHRIRGYRTLILTNYAGPSIALSGGLPEVAEDTYETMLDLLKEKNAISAQDGYGNDITGAIVQKCSVDSFDERIVHYTFTITNQFSDIDVCSQDYTLKLDRPVVVLNTTHATLATCQSFDPFSYVSTAADSYGTNITDRVEYTGVVLTDTPGTYRIVYKVTDQNGSVSDEKILTVTVESKPSENG